MCYRVSLLLWSLRERVGKIPRAQSFHIISKTDYLLPNSILLLHTLRRYGKDKVNTFLPDFFFPIFSKKICYQWLTASWCFSAVIRLPCGLHLFTTSTENLQIYHYWLQTAAYRVICSMYTILRRGSQEVSIGHWIFYEILLF